MVRRTSSINRTRALAHRRVRRLTVGSSCVAALLAAAGCKSVAGPSAAPGVSVASLAVTSRSFASGGAIPVDFTCDGADRSPELSWSAPPPGTRSFAVLVDDPDAPSGNFTHFVAYDIDASARELQEGGDPAASGGASGNNDFDRPGYGGPCPPRVQIHHYVFRVYALDTRLEIDPAVDRSALVAAMSGHVLGEGALVGLYSR